jgi:hypothetical protein
MGLECLLIFVHFVFVVLTTGALTQNLTNTSRRQRGTMIAADMWFAGLWQQMFVFATGLVIIFTAATLLLTTLLF